MVTKYKLIVRIEINNFTCS